MLLRLGTDAYLACNSPRDALPGRNPTTHRAHVLVKAQPRACVVKIPHPEHARFTLFRECLCFLLAKELDLLPPQAWAAALDVPLALLPEPLRGRSGWLDRYDEATAWCQSWFPCPDLRHTSGATLVSMMGRSKLGAGILAFDEWIANGDRHGENLLRCEDGKLIPIDHEDAFGGLSARLFDTPCDSNGALVRHRNALDSNEYLRIANQAMLAHARYQEALSKVESILPPWLYELTDCHTQVGDTLRFLKHRTGQDWFRKRVELLI